MSLTDPGEGVGGLLALFIHNPQTLLDLVPPVNSTKMLGW